MSRSASARTGRRKSWDFGSNRPRAPNSAPGLDPGVKSRGVEDVLIAIVDGLKGFPEAITAVFPLAQVQTCVVHLIRHSLTFVSYKDRKVVAAALKQIYKATDADAGKLALDDFAEGAWGKKSGHRPVLAAKLAGSHPVLCLPRRCPPDYLHHKFH